VDPLHKIPLSQKKSCRGTYNTRLELFIHFIAPLEKKRLGIKERKQDPGMHCRTRGKAAYSMQRQGASGISQRHLKLRAYLPKAFYQICSCSSLPLSLSCYSESNVLPPYNCLFTQNINKYPNGSFSKVSKEEFNEV
jgi:hypothetical protein